MDCLRWVAVSTVRHGKSIRTSRPDSLSPPTSGDKEIEGRQMITIKADGTLVFTIHLPQARRVDLVGTFDGWHESRRSMLREYDGTWELAVDPGPGEYLFRYLVDDETWLLDSTAHGTCMTKKGSEMSRVWLPPLGQDPDSLAA